MVCKNKAKHPDGECKEKHLESKYQALHSDVMLHIDSVSIESLWWRKCIMKVKREEDKYVKENLELTLIFNSHQK